jgi:hypothetical protein
MIMKFLRTAVRTAERVTLALEVATVGALLATKAVEVYRARREA